MPDEWHYLIMRIHSHRLSSGKWIHTGTRIGIMKQGKLVANFNSDDISHTDLEQLYLQHMRN